MPIDYAAQYLAWTQPTNCAFQTANDLQEELMGDDGGFTEDEWPELQPQMTAIWADVRDVMVERMEELVTLRWPEDLEDEIDAVMATTAQIATAADAGAAAETFDDWAYVVTLFADIDRESGAIIRAKLGLPTNLTEDRIEGC